MYFQTIDSIEMLLILEPPDWEKNPKLWLSLPVDMVVANNKEESPVPRGEIPLYGLEYRAIVADATRRTRLKTALNKLTTQPVACPLWVDQLTLKANVSAGGNTLTFHESSIRESQYYVVMDRDAMTYEIVEKSSINADTLTISGTLANAWTANETRFYPLLMGKLDRNKARKGIDAEADEVTFSIEESSDWADRITLANCTLSMVGSTISGKSTVRLFDMRPDWQKPREYSEFDTQDYLLGHNRQYVRFTSQEHGRNGHELEVVTDTRAEILKLETFFVDRLGSARGFYYPGWANELRLTGDIAAFGSTSITVESSPWTAAFNGSEHPQYPYLCATDAEQIMPMKITAAASGGNEDTLTMEAWANKGFHAPDTQLGFLYFGRFRRPRLEWEYDTDAVALAKLRFIELPHEYATIYDPAVKATLYKFTLRLPTGDYYYRWAAYENDVTVPGDGTYIRGGHFKWRDIHRDRTLENDGARIESVDFEDNPLALALPGGLDYPLFVRIAEVDPNDTNSVRVLFNGEVDKVTPSEHRLVASLISFGKKLMFRVPAFRLQRPCNYAWGQGYHATAARRTACAINPEDFVKTGEFHETDSSDVYSIYIENFNIDTWTAPATFNKTDLVLYNNAFYVSRADSNQGNTPAAMSAYWHLPWFYFGGGWIEIGTGDQPFF